jgi:C-terminal processing protease CtpA/Prc
MHDMKYVFYCLIFVAVCTSCASTEKHNQLIEKPLEVKQIKEDIRFVQKKINKLHPSVDWYIDKEVLNYKFDSLYNAIHTPLKPNELFLKLSPIVASVRQGHMSMQPLMKKYTGKENRELLKKGTGPLSQFDFLWKDEKLYVIENKSEDTTIVKGTQVISINDIKPEDLYQKYRKTFTSDGFNDTWYAHKFSKSFGYYFTIEKGIQDSLTYLFDHQGNTFSKTIHRIAKKEKIQAEKDSIKSKVVIKKDPLVIKAQKDSLNEDRKKKSIFGYDYKLKKYVKSLTYHEKDSSIAILKLLNFSRGNYKKAYASIFEEIKEKKVETLILDLRGNPGGRINDAEEIYSYLTPTPYQFIQRTNVTSRTSVAFNSYRGTPTFVLAVISPFVPIVSTTMYLKTSKDKDGKTYFKLKNENLHQPKENNFTGTLYVLIDGGSFSASCLLSANLKGSNRAVFVGEETGGTFNGTVAGRMPVFKTPNAQLPIRIGLMDIRTPYQLEDGGKGVVPDVEIIPTLEDKINEKDPEMDWVLKQLGIAI